ncbi:MAG TPA: hypothetical protein ACFYD2_02385 [Candidatus Avalokitesvara rifleensis]|uniref:hypothetical protein n=1 Tax=Candidatus Avalokitesvara rifleensis TaxID=3367620 RepID=UPI002712D129|nr:hypothetical protein [Candidatus Brocadiales bacterium]
MTGQLTLFKSQSNSDLDSEPYLRELGIKISESRQKIQFTSNADEPVHRWAPYIQGFSASFVRNTILRFQECYHRQKPLHVHDPFTGCGTVLVESKRLGVPSTGTELNPLLAYVASVKTGCWDMCPRRLWSTFRRLRYEHPSNYPEYLKTEQHFDKEVLKNLCLIKSAIERVGNDKIRDLFRIAFASILIGCSNLKRTPCLGYDENKEVAPDTPFLLFEAKVRSIKEDLNLIQTNYRHFIDTQATVYEADARQFDAKRIDLAITSPPYMNGLDYIMNYKIEMAWLGFINNLLDAKELKKRMVACDNVSKVVTKNFYLEENKYTNDWITDIVERIRYNTENWSLEHREKRIKRKKKNNNGIVKFMYRRNDMPVIVHKYFDDMYRVVKRIFNALEGNGRFILVVGDSFIADVYVPTDLIIARMGKEVGFSIDSVVKARHRRSGQIMSYRLRETIVTLKK